MKASFRGEKEVVELLLSAKPDTSLKNKVNVLEFVF